jgi:hypothetical protein
MALSCSKAGQDTVAEVNGENISRAELDAQVRVFRSVRTDAPDDASTRRQVLDQLIKQTLLVQAARREGLDRDPGRQRTIEERRQALRQELTRSIADLQAQLASLDQAVETKVLIDSYSQAHRTGITVTARDLQDAYTLRAQSGNLPPLNQIRDQLLDQVILDRLVEAEHRKARVRIDTDNLR